MTLQITELDQMCCQTVNLCISKLWLSPEINKTEVIKLFQTETVVKSICNQLVIYLPAQTLPTRAKKRISDLGLEAT